MDSLIGKKVIVVRDINKPASRVFNNSFFQKGEIAEICAIHKKGTFNCNVKSLDGKRTSCGTVLLNKKHTDCYHFILVDDKAAQILYGSK